MSDYIEILHKISNRLINVTDELEIYKIMNDGITNIFPSSYFIISKLQPKNMNFKIIHSFGFDNVLDNIKSLIGKDPFQMDFPFSDLSESKQKLFKTKKLYHSTGGIYELVNQQIKKSTCDVIEKTLGITEVYSIGFGIDDNYFGGAVIFLPNTSLVSGELEKESKLTLETLFAQTSFAINKLRELKKLAESQKKYKDFVNHTPDIMYKYSIKNGSLFWSDSVKTILGFDPENVLTSPYLWHESVHSEDKERVQLAEDNYLNGASYDVEYRIKSQQGKWVWLHDFFICKTQIGDDIIIEGHAMDITKRKKAEIELLNAEEKYRMITESSLDIIFIIDKSGKIIFSNKGMTPLLGYFPDDYLGKSFTQFVPITKVSNYLKKLKDVFLNQEVRDFNTQIYHKDGSLVDVEINGKLIRHEGKLAAQGTIRDITNRKRLEDELKESEEKYKSIFNNLPDVLWSLSYPDFKPLYISKSALDLYGYTAEQFIKDPLLWDNSTHPEDRHLVESAILDLKNTGKSKRECRIICSNGEVKTVIDRSWLIYENKVPVRVDGIAKDITKRYQAEQALKASENRLKELNATRDKFFSIIAHDLKSPFNSMLGFSSVLNENFEDYDSNKQKEFIGIINDELQGTYKLLENLLYWSRSQRGSIAFKPEKLNVSEIIGEALQLLIQSAKKKSIQFKNQIPSNIDVEADREMLLTIIRNLISNAIKFTPKDGKIFIDVKRSNQDNEVEISIKDNGIGISKKIQSVLFDIGENTTRKGTENEKGTGLGLILCKEFVEKHHGQIGVESEVNKGATFTVSIPVELNKE